jgi:hypothetical protein
VAETSRKGRCNIERSYRLEKCALEKDGEFFDCRPEDNRLFEVRRGLCETSSVVASVLGIPFKTDSRITDNTPTKGIVALFKHFGKGPTFVYIPFGIEMILRGNPETGEKEFFPSVNIDSSRLGLTKDLGDGVDTNGRASYESIKPFNEKHAVFPGVQKDVHIVYPVVA